MTEMSLKDARKLLSEGGAAHFMGAGGIGMSALARLLKHRGIEVTGCDAKKSATTEMLQAEGIPVQIGHSPDHLRGADALVYTTAVEDTEPELVAAQEQGMPTIKRAELLAAYVELVPRRIAVTGTHGKTTTCALIGYLLEAAGADPLVLVGGLVARWQGNVRFSKDENWAVFEACESDDTLLLYTGASQVITSLEREHVDRHGSFERLVATVRQFAATADPEGFVVANAGSELVRDVAAQAPARKIWYGRPGQFWATDVSFLPDGLEFTAHGPGGSQRVKVPLYGLHNVCNVLAALACVHGAGFNWRELAASLERFCPVARRFEIVGRVGESIVVDDYAHHPTEVEATIRAAKQHFGRPVLAVFQPHTYTRTKDLAEKFATAFGDADEVVITEIYTARGPVLEGVSGKWLAELIARSRGGRPTQFVASHEAIAEILAARTDGWLLLIMGAGDINRVAQMVAAREGADEALSKSP